MSKSMTVKGPNNSFHPKKEKKKNKLKMSGHFNYIVNELLKARVAQRRVDSMEVKPAYKAIARYTITEADVEEFKLPAQFAGHTIQAKVKIAIGKIKTVK